MSIETRIQAINDHLVDDYKVLRLAGADLTNVNKNIVNLKMSWKERLLYFMNNGTDEVWDNWDKVSGTGTTLSLNNTEEAPMSLTYKGNTSQTGTPTPSSPIPVQVVSGDNSIEVCGKNLFNSNVEVNSTFTSSVATALQTFKTTGKYATGYCNKDNVITTYAVYQTCFVKVAENTNYYLSSQAEENNGFSSIIILDDSGNSLSASGNWIGGGYSFTTPSNAKYVMFGTRVSNIDYIQLEVGTLRTDLSPYESNSYPISLGVENVLNISSNLGRTTSNGITFVPVFNDDGTLKYISVNGTATATANMQLAGTQTLNGSYTLSSGIGINNNIYIQCLKTSDYTAALRTDLPYNTGTFSNVNVVTYLYVKNGTTANNIKIYPMIEKGLVEHQYNPYGKTPIELCKIGTYQDKIDKSSGKNLAQMSLYNANNYVSQKLTLEAGNYYFAYTGDNASAIYIRKADGSTPINGTSVKERYNGTTIYFTTNETGEYYIQCYLGGGGFTKFTEAMLNEGTDYLPYEPYGTSWYLKKEIGKVVLNENSNVGVSASTNYSTCYLSDLLNVATTTSSSVGYSNYFKINYNNVIGNAYFTSSKYLYMIMDTSINNSTTFKTWLGTHNTEVYYVLATPTYETITDTTLIGQLEALKKSVEGQTNISQVNNDLPFELSVTALEVMS